MRGKHHSIHTFSTCNLIACFTVDENSQRGRYLQTLCGRGNNGGGHNTFPAVIGLEGQTCGRLNLYERSDIHRSTFQTNEANDPYAEAIRDFGRKSPGNVAMLAESSADASSKQT